MNASHVSAIALLLALCAIPGTRAATVLEMSAGISYGTPQPNGIWYQKGHPYKLDTTSSALAVGLRTDIAPHVAMHVGGFWLGSSRSDARAVSDEQYQPDTPTHCLDECLPTAHFKGHGRVWGLQALAEFHTGGAWDVGFLIGPMLYRSTWSMTVPDWRPVTQTSEGFSLGPVYPIQRSDSRWVLSAAAGSRLTHGRQFIELMFYRDGAQLRPNTQYWPPVWKYHTVLSYGITF